MELWIEFMILQTIIGYCFALANEFIGLYNIRDLNLMKGDFTIVKFHKRFGWVEIFIFYAITIQCLYMFYLHVDAADPDLYRPSGVWAHSWIGGFCDTCGRCIRSCPEKAIREHPLIHDSGRKTHIIREKCLPFFVTKHGCTICVKECSFAKRRYEDIYKAFVRLQGKKNQRKRTTHKNGRGAGFLWKSPDSNESKKHRLLTTVCNKGNFKTPQYIL